MGKKKNKIGIVYSTNPDHQYDYDSQEQENTLDPGDQKLLVALDKKQRKGKQVTLITGFIGQSDDLKDLAKTLKTKCGVGGSAKDGEIILQGDFRTKAADLLREMGYQVKQR